MKNYLRFYYLLVGICIIFSVFGNSNCEKNENDLNANKDTVNDEDEDASSIEIDKKAVDRMKFYGGLGKRFQNFELIGSQEDTDEDSSEYTNGLSKRLDKMKYFGGLGKRKNDNFDRLINYNNFKRLDKMKYFGGLGKRADLSSESLKSKLNYLAKKSKGYVDRLRYMGNLGK